MVHNLLTTSRSGSVPSERREQLLRRWRATILLLRRVRQWRGLASSLMALLDLVMLVELLAPLVHKCQPLRGMF
jgi:hypothetical protein